MKRISLFLSILGMVLFLNGACSLSSSTDDSNTDTGPTYVQEEEPNNERSQADYLSSDEIGQGTIASSSDPDWWKVSVGVGYPRDVQITADSTFSVEVQYWGNSQLNAVTTYTGTSFSRTIDPSGSDGDFITYYFTITASSSVDYEITKTQ